MDKTKQKKMGKAVSRMEGVGMQENTDYSIYSEWLSPVMLNFWQRMEEGPANS